jgi:RNA polymerase sigma-70 factor (ECF subfamily)
MNAGGEGLDIDAVFRDQYERIARVIARVLRDPARAEELAVEVFLKWSRTPRAQGDDFQAWLYRVAVRSALDELRRETRRAQRWRFLPFGRRPPTPEDLRASKENQENVRTVLAVMKLRQAELLVLRSQGLSYDELAQTLDIRRNSVGRLLSRAGEIFRKEYIKRYGQQ